MGMDIEEVLGGALDCEEEAGKDDVFEIIPAGWYPADVEDTSLVENTKKTGFIVKAKSVILGDKFGGRVVYGNHNIKNPSKTSEQIGKREVGMLGLALGQAHVTTVIGLTGQCLIKVEVTPANEKKGYKEGNAVVGYKKLGADTVEAPTKANPPQETAKETTGNTSTDSAPTTAASGNAPKMPWE